ncbi:MAG: 50S ribosomal protein L6 [Acidobacteriota bacterium]
MSRIGKLPIPVPKGATITIEDGRFHVKGKKGEVTERLLPECPVTLEDGVIRVTRIDEQGPTRAKQGLIRSLLANAVRGVTEGWEKKLAVVGVGYRADVKGKQINFALGYSHDVIYPIPEGIEVEIDKSNNITVRGANKQKVGQVAAELRSLRPPDPYKAKGIRYADENIRRKVGKAGGR